MPVTDLIARFGYAAVAAGTFFEGETVAVAAGYLSHHEFLNLWGVMAAAFVGAICGDQLFFHLGRRHGAKFLARRPRLRARVQRVEQLVARRGDSVAFWFRWVYGTRIVAPVALGAAGFGRARFAAINTLSAALWASLFVTAGRAFGDATERLLDNVRSYRVQVAVGLVSVAALVWVVRLAWRALRDARRRRRSGDAPPRR